jgi:ribonuclease HI
MGKRNWVCFDCRSAVRREDGSVTAVPCATCSKPLVNLGYKIPIPPKNKANEWETLRTQYFLAQREAQAPDGALRNSEMKGTPWRGKLKDSNLGQPTLAVRKPSGSYERSSDTSVASGVVASGGGIRSSGQTSLRMKSPAKRVVIFTDGACIGNPGPGGYGVVLQYGEHRRELSGGFRRTTNNRMELTAAIKALEALKEPCQVTLFSDSEYVVKGIMKGWARSWRANSWRRLGKTVPNWELWNRLLELCEHHHVQVRWVEGHAGHLENERCDVLAVSAATGSNLPIDLGYERPPSPAV